MFGWNAYSVGYDAGRSDEQTGKRNLEVVHQILYGERPVTVDQSYIDQLHAALAKPEMPRLTTTPLVISFKPRRLSGKNKAHQFRNEALYWRDQKFAPRGG